MSDSKLIIFTTAYQSNKEIAELSKAALQTAANTFQHSLLRGIKNEFKGEIFLVNCLPVGTWPRQYKKLCLESKDCEIEGCSGKEIGGINLPVFKQIHRASQAKKLLRKVLKPGDKVLVYSAYLPFVWAAAHIKECNSAVVVTDLPEYYDYQKTSWLRRFLRKIVANLTYKYLASVKRYVLLTDAMKDPLNVGNRPYVVAEGICDSGIEAQNKNYTASSGEVFFYSGTLAYVFGIKTLLDAVLRMERKDVELWVCGKGEASADLELAAKNDPRIKYFGFCTKEKVTELRSHATVLVNPRPNDADFTKYSFPSKTMEYMTSAIPVVMYKLAGVPDEYDEYLYLVDDKKEDALKEKLEEVIAIPKEERCLKAERARKFVLEQKNENAQARKIVELLMG